MESRRLLKGLHQQPDDIAGSSRACRAELYEIDCLRGVATRLRESGGSGNDADADGSGHKECQIASAPTDEGADKKARMARPGAAGTSANVDNDEDELAVQFDKVKWRRSDWRFSFTGESVH